MSKGKNNGKKGQNQNKKGAVRKKKSLPIIPIVIVAAVLVAAAVFLVIHLTGNDSPAPGTVVNGQNPIVTIEMDDGQTMRLELYPDMAPNTVANFIYLAQQGFYDGLVFHRLIPGFMIQGGCPNGTGGGGPGYFIKGEFPANGFTQNTLLHERGVISMARATPFDSAGSQFFIMHDDAPFLDEAGYAAFGRVIEGIEVVDDIVMDPTTGFPNDIAIFPRTIRRITVDTFGADFGEPEKLPR